MKKKKKILQSSASLTHGWVGRYFLLAANCDGVGGTEIGKETTILTPKTNILPVPVNQLYI